MRKTNLQQAQQHIQNCSLGEIQNLHNTLAAEVQAFSGTRQYTFTGLSGQKGASFDGNLAGLEFEFQDSPALVAANDIPAEDAQRLKTFVAQNWKEPVGRNTQWQLVVQGNQIKKARKN